MTAVGKQQYCILGCRICAGPQDVEFASFQLLHPEPRWLPRSPGHSRALNSGLLFGHQLLGQPSDLHPWVWESWSVLQVYFGPAWSGPAHLVLLMSLPQLHQWPDSWWHWIHGARARPSLLRSRSLAVVPTLFAHLRSGPAHFQAIFQDQPLEQCSSSQMQVLHLKWRLLSSDTKEFAPLILSQTRFPYSKASPIAKHPQQFLELLLPLANSSPIVKSPLKKIKKNSTIKHRANDCHRGDCSPDLGASGCQGVRAPGATSAVSSHFHWNPLHADTLEESAR